MSKKKNLLEHSQFLVLLLLFVGFSVFGIVNFFTSTNNYLDVLQADVTGSDNLVVSEGANPVEISKDNPFSDLSPFHQNADAIVALYYEGIVNGYEDGTFKPDNKVTRAEFAKMLVEAGDLDYTTVPSGVLANCFTDVNDLPGHWFAPPVCASKYSGWINGYSDGSFGPNRNIVKAEAIKILLSAFELDIPDAGPVSKYSDIQGNEWFAAVAHAAGIHGIVKEGGIFLAEWEMTRGDTAQIIYNAMMVQ